MKKYDELIKINQNRDWPYIPDRPYRILILDGSRSGKTNALMNLIKNQRLGIVKIYLCIKNLFQSKYQLFINGGEKAETKKWKYPKAFIDYWQTIDDFYENLENYNPEKKRKVLIVFTDMTADLEANKKSSPIVFELFQEAEYRNLISKCLKL